MGFGPIAKHTELEVKLLWLLFGCDRIFAYAREYVSPGRGFVPPLPTSTRIILCGT